MKGAAATTAEPPHNGAAAEASDRARLQQHRCKGLPGKKNRTAKPLRIFFCPDAKHPCSFAAGTSREAETSTELTGKTAAR